MTQTFEQWMEAVDAAVYALAGCSVHDLADCLYADWYADGVSPCSAAARAIAYDQGNDKDDDEWDGSAPSGTDPNVE